MPRAFGLTTLCRALHRVDLDDERWLRLVLRELAPIIDRDRLGCVATTFRLARRATFAPEVVVVAGMHERLRAAFDNGLRNLPREYVIERYFNRSWSFGTTLPGWSRIPGVVDGTLCAFGVRDLFVVTALAPDGQGCSFGGFSRQEASLHRDVAELLPEFVLHLRAALSLRARISGRRNARGVLRAMDLGDDPAHPRPAPRGWAGAPSRGGDGGGGRVLQAHSLSPRQEQTLRLLLAGLSDKEIASRLGITRHTVNQYTKAIYARFGVHSRSALLSRWIDGARSGLPSLISGK